MEIGAKMATQQEGSPKTKQKSSIKSDWESAQFSRVVRVGVFRMEFPTYPKRWISLEKDKDYTKHDKCVGSVRRRY